MSLTIRALSLGGLRNVPLASLTFGMGWGEVIETSMIMYLIEGGDNPIVVDTGAPSPRLTMVHHGYELIQSAEMEPAAQLARHGVELGDVKTVINTHLHWDHCSNNHMFPEAEFVIQKRELAYAVDPLPLHRKAYEKLPGLRAPWMSVWDRIETVDGDEEIAPGVRVVSLPGHTPGSQGVLVATAAGDYLIAGDAVDLYANWAGTPEVAHTPSSIHINLVDYYASFEKIEKLACEVIPSHDPKVLSKGHFG